MSDLWYEKDLPLDGNPSNLIITVRGHYDQSRVSIAIEFERVDLDGTHAIEIFNKAGEPGRHIVDSLQASHLLRLQKLIDALPKTWPYFRSWAISKSPDLDSFLPSTPSGKIE
jgi:hypothetical protein